MFELQQIEYHKIGYFSDDLKYKATHDLLQQKRALIVTASIVLFYFLAQINVESISLGLIKGNIGRPEIIPISLVLIFLYRFLLFYILFQKELKTHSFVKYSKSSYAREIVRFLVNTRVLNSNIPTQPIKHIHSNSTGYGLQVFEQNIPKVKFENYDFITIQSTSSSTTYNVSVKYELNQLDKEIFERNYHSLKYTLDHQFLHFIFPVLYSALTFIVVVLSFIF